MKKHYITPTELRDRETCLEAIPQVGLALQYVPEPRRDREICLAAILQDGVALQYVPEPRRDPEPCMEAMQGLKRRRHA